MIVEETAEEELAERKCLTGDGTVIALGYDSVDPATFLEIHGD